MSNYSNKEEKINIYSHLFGVFLGVVGLFFLGIKSGTDSSLLDMVSFFVFGISIILMFSASAFYHGTKNEKLRFRRKVYDHAAIYILIAGTYTPFSLVTIGGTDGWILFSIIWTLAITGIVLKLFFTGRYKIISTLMYVFMGWLIIFYVGPLKEVIAEDGFSLLLLGGILYSIGAIFYIFKKIAYTHAIFHLFVLGGCISHFFSIYWYV